MEKLYYKDFYTKDFVADVTEALVIEGKYHIVLDKTAFFPGGGGQFCDNGYIDNKKVIDVYEKNDKVYHILDEDINNYKSLKCSINWQRRLDGMEQHFAQHVLSGCFYKLFNRNTVSFHLGKESSTVDIEGDFSYDELLEVEKMANDIISKNLKTEVIVPNKKDLESIKLRRDLPNTNSEIRIIKIGELDINACCGIHLNSTLELRMIKIIKTEKNRSATRVEYLAGKRAIDYSLKRDIHLSEVCKYLKSKDLDIVNTIDNIYEKVDKYKSKIKNLESKLLTNELNEFLNGENEFINGITLFNKIYFDYDLRFIKNISQNLTNYDNKIFIGVLRNDNNASLILSSSKNIDVDMRDILKDILLEFSGKGGGNKNLVQASIDGDYYYKLNLVTKEKIKKHLL